MAMIPMKTIMMPKAMLDLSSGDMSTLYSLFGRDERAYGDELGRQSVTSGDESLNNTKVSSYAHQFQREGPVDAIT
jgi:hypothetical protein